MIYKSEKCFGIAGKAWAAVKDGVIVEVISMAKHPEYSAYDKEVQKAAGVTRYCPAAVRMAEKISEFANIISECADEEESKFENLPESLQSGAVGVALEEAASQLREAEDSLTGVYDILQEVSNE